MAKKVKVFVSSSCPPCAEIKEKIEQGKFNVEDVDLIDVETEDGFKYIKKLNLTSLPSAYLGTKQCRLGFSENDEIVVIECESQK